MDDIRVEIDHENDLIRATILDRPDADRVIDAFRSLDFGQATRMIWDYRAGSLSALGHENFTRIARAASELDRDQSTRALVFVVGSDDAGLLMKLYSDISRYKIGRNVEYHITTDMDDAHAWLDRRAPARRCTDTDNS